MLQTAFASRVVLLTMPITGVFCCSSSVRRLRAIGCTRASRQRGACLSCSRTPTRQYFAVNQRPAHCVATPGAAWNRLFLRGLDECFAVCAWGRRGLGNAETAAAKQKSLGCLRVSEASTQPMLCASCSNPVCLALLYSENECPPLRLLVFERT